MAHTHYTGLAQGRGLLPGTETMSFYIILCTVHSTQGQGPGTIVFYCPILVPMAVPVLVQCMSHYKGAKLTQTYHFAAFAQ